MTHKELVKRAEKWLRGTMRCPVVLIEMVCMGNEVPDAIGWRSYRSILVECKATRPDFLKDRKKFFRSNSEYGMGDFRYYMTPPGLIDVDELPQRWGLLEAREKQTRVIMHASSFDKTRAAFKERPLLFSALRRLMEAQPEQLSF